MPLEELTGAVKESITTLTSLKQTIINQNRLLSSQSEEIYKVGMLF